MTAPLAPSADPASVDSTGAGSRRPRRLLVALGVALLLTVLLRGVVEPYYVASDSMAPDYRLGDRVLVSKLGVPWTRGSVVLIDTRAFGGEDRSLPLAEGVLGRLLAGSARALGVELSERSEVVRVTALAGEPVTGKPGMDEIVPLGSVQVSSGGPGGIHALVKVDDIIGVVTTRIWPLT